MPLAMRDKVFITAALTGSGSTQDRSDKVPRSPEQIATAAIDAAKAGAAVVHCHVRDPETGAPDRAVHLYREVVERIRESDTDVVINLTAGMGGDIVFGPTDAPLPLSEQGTDMASAAERFSISIAPTAASTHSGRASSTRSAVQTSPVPSGFVRISESPGRPPEFRTTASGWTSPMTLSP